MTEAELAESIYWEAEQYIPFDIQDVNLDYQILDAGDRPAARARMEVLLVAAKKEKIADYTGVIAPGRPRRRWSSTSTPSRCRTPTRSTTASSRARSSCCSTPAPARSTSTSCSGDQSVFTRDISIGGNAYTEAVQKELNLPFEQAEQLKSGAAGRRRHLRGRAAGAARGHRERAARGAEDVRLLQGDGVPPISIDRIVLSGGASRVEGFAEMLSERFDAPVELFDPFKQRGLRRREARRRRRRDVAPTAAVAVGLALRRVGDR